MLRQTLFELRFPLSDEKRAAVRAHVFDFVDEKKAEGWPPEQVIVAVKRIADDVGLRASPGVIYKREAWRPSDALLIDMVKWCVERYFGQVPAETEAK